MTPPADSSPGTLTPWRPEDAAWIRDHVWTPGMRRQPYWIPGTSTAVYDHALALALCVCMVGTCSNCRSHRHHLCHALRIRPQPEWYLQVPGSHRAVAVWQAGRACRSLCPCPHTAGRTCRCSLVCTCHLASTTYEQDALFDLAGVP